MTFRIGPYQFDSPLALAPMAGVTDRPFRQMCREHGASMTVSEMVNSKAELRNTRKSMLRTDHQGEPEPVIVQIAGADPQTMADAARYNVDLGAQIIDINMGCPAKKVCCLAAGSALLQDEQQVGRILEAVVAAVDVPVTLKTRTGWARQHKNIARIAGIAEQSGIAALTVHGRSREDKFLGQAEFDSLRMLKDIVSIPLIANGDIDSEKKARTVMDFSGADAIMVGRAAQKRPWIFQHIRHYLETGQQLQQPGLITRKSVLLKHLNNLYQFYGEFQGLRVARKHINWQMGDEPVYRQYIRPQIMAAESTRQQTTLIHQCFDRISDSQLAAVS